MMLLVQDGLALSLVGLAAGVAGFPFALSLLAELISLLACEVEPGEGAAQLADLVGTVEARGRGDGAPLG